MAKGVTLPFIYKKQSSSSSTEYKRNQTVDRKKIRHSDWRLPSLSYTDKQQVQTQLITIAETNEGLTINENDNIRIERCDGGLLYKKTNERNRQSSRSTTARKIKKMFSRMSNEAQEAYNQTLQEMAEDKTGESSDGHHSISSGGATSGDITNHKSIWESTCSNTSSLSKSERNGKLQNDNDRQSDADKRPNCIPRLLSKTITSESAVHRRQMKRHRRKLPSQRMPKQTTTKAPFSHTALRIRRKQQSKENEDLSTVRSSSGQESLENLPNITRPFEITPMGYDSRYIGDQAVHACVQYNTDEDEALATYVIEKATQKCKHWLVYQNSDS